jgi:4a-hydroxytetrahydrobiopterin dehydratase
MANTQKLHIIQMPISDRYARSEQEKQMAPSLESEKCVPCRGGIPTLSDEEIDLFYNQLKKQWLVVEKDGIKRLEKSFKFKDFAQALAFTNKVGELAEKQGHHPDILTEWGNVTVSWWTHKIKGLHKNDFIMAAKTDAVYY